MHQYPFLLRRWDTNTPFYKGDEKLGKPGSQVTCAVNQACHCFCSIAFVHTWKLKINIDCSQNSRTLCTFHISVLFLFHQLQIFEVQMCSKFQNAAKVHNMMSSTVWCFKPTTMNPISMSLSERKCRHCVKGINTSHWSLKGKNSVHGTVFFEAFSPFLLTTPSWICSLGAILQCFCLEVQCISGGEFHFDINYAVTKLKQKSQKRWDLCMNCQRNSKLRSRYGHSGKWTFNIEAGKILLECYLMGMFFSPLKSLTITWWSKRSRWKSLKMFPRFGTANGMTSMEFFWQPLIWPPT